MALRQVSGRWRLGLALSLSTALRRATLPLALWLAWRGQLGACHQGMFAIAALTLFGNDIFYLLGVRYTTPPTPSC